MLETIILDSVAFIKCSDPQKLAKRFYTIPEVVNEIRDKETRARLQVLPYELSLTEPNPHCIQAAAAWARATGDFAALSLTDLKLIALTIQLSFAGRLEKIPVAPQNLPDNTNRNKVIIKSTTELRHEARPHYPGFYTPSQATNTPSTRSRVESCQSELDRPLIPKPGDSQPTTLQSEPEIQQERSSPEQDSIKNALEQLCISSPEVAAATVKQPAETASANDVAITCDTQRSNAPPPATPHNTSSETAVVEPDEQVTDEEEVEEEEEDGEEVEVVEDEEGWVGEHNLHEALARCVSSDLSSASGDAQLPTVACLTSDFAMQNVLLHMGLHVVSPTGQLIREIRTYVRRCTACFNIENDPERVAFCSRCGLQSLRRVLARRDPETGQLTVYINFNRPLTQRGLRFSKPLPRGGKHAMNVRVCESQRAPQQRVSKKSRARAGELQVRDYEASGSENPFRAHDLQSRSARLGIRHPHESAGRVAASAGVRYTGAAPAATWNPRSHDGELFLQLSRNPNASRKKKH